MSLFGRRSLDFLREAEGSVAIVFGLTIFLVVGAVGLAVDYGRVSQGETRLQEEADSAVLSAVTRLNGSTAPHNQQAETLQTDALATFKALAAQNGFTLNSASASAGAAPQDLSVTVNYTAGVPAVFGQMIGLHSYSVSGASTATAAAPSYVDIYLLVDNSTSMGVGASDADVLLMNQTLTCMVGCHNQGTDVQAHQAGATLRFDVVKTAIQQILSMAQKGATSGRTVQFALMTFAGTVGTVAPIGTNLNEIQNDVANLQLANLEAGTSTDYALQYVKSQISAIGDGSSAAKPEVYVILATDGTSDSTDNTAGGGRQISTTFLPAFSPVQEDAPFPHALPSPVNNWYMELEGLDPAWCQPLKSMGANVMTLEMPYVIPTPATLTPQTYDLEMFDPRIIYVRDYLLPVIPAQMTACASQPNYHISASSPSEITAAMSSLFQLTQTSEPRLSK